MIARPVVPGDPRLVLVVDDDDGIRAVLRELLQEERYGVETAENGAEALTSLRTGALSRVILLDLTMPKRLHARPPRSPEAARQVRKRARSRHALGEWIERA
jgi:CheY-like chemotaxis protein